MDSCDTFDLRLLEEPPFDGYAMPELIGQADYNAEGCWNLVLPEEDPNWLESGEIRCAFPEAIIHVAFARALAVRHPRAAKFLGQVFLDPGDIDRWVAQMRDGTSAEEVARQWIAVNSETVAVWLDGT